MNKSFEDFKKEINLAEFCQNYGFELNKKKSTADAKVMQIKVSSKTVETIIVRQNKKNGQYYYVNPIDFQDKGSLIDFVLRRENQSDLTKISQILHKYTGIILKEGIKKKSLPILPTEEKKPILDAISFFKLSKLEDRSYLHSRGISDKTIDSKEFQNRIFSRKVKKENGILYKNTAFPMFNECGLSGVEMKNFTFNKGAASGSDKSNSLFISKYEKNTKIDNIIFCESPIDCLSFHQLHKKELEKNIYVASNGSLTESQIRLAQKLINKTHPEKIILGNDNDKEKLVGQLYNLNLAGQLNVPNGNKSINEELSTHSNSIIVKSSLSATQITSFFEFNFEDKESGILKIKEIDNKIAGSFTDNVFEGYSSIVKELGDHKGVLEISVNRSIQNIENLEKSIPHIRGIEEFISIKKPLQKDFNEDLKLGNQHNNKDLGPSI